MRPDWRGRQRKEHAAKAYLRPRNSRGICGIRGEILTAGEHFGYLPQELPQALHNTTIYEYLTETGSIYDKSPNELAQLCAKMGFPVERLYADELLAVLSGGEKIKVQLIRLLIESPTILLLDEPSNDLDIETLVWLENFICSSDIPVLYISHDETLLERTANMIVHMEQIKNKTAVYRRTHHLPELYHKQEPDV